MAELTVYGILGMSSDASAEDIVRAYRNVSHCVQTDSGDPKAIFELVETAHKTLSNPPLRTV